MHPKRQRFTAHTELGTGVGHVSEGEAEGQVSGDTWPSFYLGAGSGLDGTGGIRSPKPETSIETDPHGHKPTLEVTDEG